VETRTEISFPCGGKMKKRKAEMELGYSSPYFLPFDGNPSTYSQRENKRMKGLKEV